VSLALFPPVVFAQIGREDLNERLVAWGHRMGPIHRPTGGWSHGLVHDGELVAVVATDTLIRERVAGLTRHEAVELSRLCAARPDLCRVTLRLWRSFVFPALRAECGFVWAVSYQDAAIHSGRLYRFDGWVRLAASRSGTDSRSGRKGRRKGIWGWSDDAETRSRRGEAASALPVA
jgi:antitoxin VapB